MDKAKAASQKRTMKRWLISQSSAPSVLVQQQPLPLLLSSLARPRAVRVCSCRILPSSNQACVSLLPCCKRMLCKSFPSYPPNNRFSVRAQVRRAGADVPVCAFIGFVVVPFRRIIVALEYCCRFVQQRRNVFQVDHAFFARVLTSRSIPQRRQCFIYRVCGGSSNVIDISFALLQRCPLKRQIIAPRKSNIRCSGWWCRILFTLSRFGCQ